VRSPRDAGSSRPKPNAPPADTPWLLSAGGASSGGFSSAAGSQARVGGTYVNPARPGTMRCLHKVAVSSAGGPFRSCPGLLA
jgi:hypothetical protein